jgi:hypothetical protein
MNNKTLLHRILAMGIDLYLEDPEWLDMPIEINEEGERVRKKIQK